MAIAGCASGALASFAGCMGEGTTCPPLDAGTHDATADAADAGDAALPPPAALRLANLSPTAPPIDFCIGKCPASGCAGKLPTSAFQGPLLAGVAAAIVAAGDTIDGGAEGLPYPWLSSYVPVASFQGYAIRIVAGGSPDCSAGVVPDITDLPVLSSGAVATIALLGELQPTSTLHPTWLLDEPNPTAVDGGAGKMLLRFLHAAPGLSMSTVDMGLDTSGKTPLGQVPTLFFTDVAYGKTGLKGQVSNITVVNGYLVTKACPANAMNCPLVAVQPSSADAGPLVVGTFPTAAGAVVTVMLVGDTDEAGAGAPYELVECVDNAVPATVFGACSVLQPPQ